MTLLRHCRVLTMDARLTVIDDGALAIQGNSLAYVGADRELPPISCAKRPKSWIFPTHW
jgi:hypothetical protein